MALLQPSRQVLCSTSSECRAKACAFTSSTQRKRNVVVRAARQDNSTSADRRSVLGGLAALLAAPALFEQRAALADEAPASEYSTFLGMATPPTSYGGYGGNAVELPKYTFEYPTGWKSEKPSKVEKGTQGVDGRVVSPRGKDQRAFVITLGRAGEDGKTFKINDLDSTFAGFAGADYKILDALSSATNIVKSERSEGDITFYQFDIDSPEYRYLSSIAVKQGKVFALFVSSPSRSFKASEGKLRHIVETFKLL